jgi:hypothetical protein
MPKNKGKGGKNRRRGKNEGEEKRELITKDEGQGEFSMARRRPFVLQLLVFKAFFLEPPLQSMPRLPECLGRVD